MNKPIKLLLGALSVTPLVCLFYSVIQMLSGFDEIAGAGGSAGPGRMASLMEDSLAIQGTMMFLVVGQLVFYLWHLLVRRAQEDMVMKLLWAMLLLFGSIITIPLYWFLHIWSEPRRARAT